MNSCPGSIHENRLTAVEANILKEVTAHMDAWIDHVCECADQLLKTNAFFAGVSQPEAHVQAEAVHK